MVQYSVAPASSDGAALARGSVTLSDSPAAVTTSLTVCAPTGMRMRTCTLQRPAPGCECRRRFSGRAETITRLPSMAAATGSVTVAPASSATVDVPPSRATISPVSRFAVPTKLLTNSVRGRS